MVAFVCALVLFIAPVAFAQQSPFLPVPLVPDKLQFSAQLPDFEVKDINGRIWRSADLRGKFTLVYIFHTAPARDADARPDIYRNFLDLAGLQRFYDKVKDAKNIQVLGLCTDYDYTHAPEYMKQAKYTFPVIADWVLINKLFPDAGGRPPYWLVSPEGQRSDPLQAWSFGGALYELERVAARLP